jgi:hypothetical protein
MTDFCCDECSYWEDRADINTENEIKMKVKTEETTIIAIPVHETKITKPVDNEYNNKVIEVLAVEKVEVGKPKSPQ